MIAIEADGTDTRFNGV